MLSIHLLKKLTYSRTWIISTHCSVPIYIYIYYIYIYIMIVFCSYSMCLPSVFPKEVCVLVGKYSTKLKEAI